MKTPYRNGIEDYEAGRPFPLTYDKWSEEAQNSYERGRLHSAAAKMKRRALGARRFGGARDEQASQALAEDYRDPDRPLISEDGQPVFGRVGLPRSRRP